MSRIASHSLGLSPDTPTAAGTPEATGARRNPLQLDDSLTLGEYVTPDQLAQHLGVSIRTLSRWHARRIGPPRCSVGKLILYRVAAVRKWMAECEFGPPSPTTRRSAGRHR
jgi:hypothetical protein